MALFAAKRAEAASALQDAGLDAPRADPKVELKLLREAAGNTMQLSPLLLTDHNMVNMRIWLWLRQTIEVL